MQNGGFDIDWVKSASKLQTITADSLEDNQLCLRQLFGVTAQAVAAGYIFFQTHPRGKSQLLMPSIFVFIAGTIKCFERIRAMHLASEKNVLVLHIFPFSFFDEKWSFVNKDQIG
ncbi:hypothetical protein WN944_004610 [Citrus x changshan-huyou]|uniref:DUF4220 domain-containing protein n=1 Tax=Citrus x changshan-huyou TaxID=2935761 RepID=A0AAP0M5C0_9ROSI